MRAMNVCPFVVRGGIRTSPCIRHRIVVRGVCLRLYSQSSTPVPPPAANEITSKSSGLNHQLHPAGRPPLNPLHTASTTAETYATMRSTDPVTPVAGGYRTPLRVPSNAPVSARNTVKVVYEAPYRKTVRGLKLFSVASLVLSTSMTPFILSMEANLPMVARVSMITAGKNPRPLTSTPPNIHATPQSYSPARSLLIV